MGSINRSAHEPYINNECIDCGNPTTVEGIACRPCWDLVPGNVKAQYVAAMKQVALSIHAAKLLKGLSD